MTHKGLWIDYIRPILIGGGTVISKMPDPHEITPSMQKSLLEYAYDEANFEHFSDWVKEKRQIARDCRDWDRYWDSDKGMKVMKPGLPGLLIIGPPIVIGGFLIYAMMVGISTIIGKFF